MFGCNASRPYSKYSIFFGAMPLGPTASTAYVWVHCLLALQQVQHMFGCSGSRPKRKYSICLGAMPLGPTASTVYVWVHCLWALQQVQYCLGSSTVGSTVSTARLGSLSVGATRADLALLLRRIGWTGTNPLTKQKSSLLIFAGMKFYCYNNELLVLWRGGALRRHGRGVKETWA